MTDLTPEGLRGLAKDLAARLGYAAGAGESFSPLILAAFTALVAEVDKLHEEALADILRLRVAEARRAQRAEIQEFIERVPDRTLTEVITFVRQIGIRAQEETT